MALTLEGKPVYIGLIIGLIIAALFVVGVQYFIVNDIEEKIRADNAKLVDLEKKIENGKAAERKLPQFREEVARLELELDKLRRILPSTRNTEEIIKKIKALVDAGDFALRKLTFPNLSPATGNEPYSEWPISVTVEGRYHNLAILFNHLSSFSRIINVETFSVNALSAQTERTITADFVAKTFVYSEPKQETKPATTKKPGGAKPGGTSE